MKTVKNKLQQMIDGFTFFITFIAVTGHSGNYYLDIINGLQYVLSVFVSLIMFGSIWFILSYINFRITNHLFRRR